MSINPLSRRELSVGQRGFTLVELMVGIALGLVLMLALVTLLINISRSNTELARTNSVIENGRFSLVMLEQDLSHAGYWGGWVPQFDDLSLTTVPGDVPAASDTEAAPDPCVAYSSWTADYRKKKIVGIPVQSYEVPSSGTAPVCSSLVTNAKATPFTNDLLFVRHAAPCAGSLTATDTDCKLESSQQYLQVGRCIPLATGSDPMTLTFAQSGTSTGIAAFTGFVEKNRGCPATLPTTFGVGKNDRPVINKYVSNMYYVRNYAVTSGDGIPTLMRSRFSGTAYQTAEALVEGVEGFRVEFGIDNVAKSGAALNAASFAAGVNWQNPARQVTPTNRGDGNPDTYVRCTTASPCTAFQLMNVVAVKLFVLVRASSPTPGHSDTRRYCLQSECASDTERVGPFNDSYKRHVYTRTIRLTNVSMRREVPPGS